MSVIGDVIHEEYERLLELERYYKEKLTNLELATYDFARYQTMLEDVQTYLDLTYKYLEFGRSIGDIDGD